MKCPICFESLIDVGDGYECKGCSYFLEYDELDVYDEEDDGEDEYSQKYESKYQAGDEEEYEEFYEGYE